MRVNFWLFIVTFTLCLVSINSRNEENDSSNDEELFVPTRDWQVVKKGQKIPKGLHVRVNFETGVTEAKILDENENKKTTAVVEIPETNENRPENSNSETADNLKFSEAELKEALKNIKNNDVTEGSNLEHVKNNFRSYEELKKELGDLNLTPKTDAEMLNELITKYKQIKKDNNENVFQKLDILEDLEFLVHQFDNANEFIRLDGFREVIYHNLNSTHVEIKREALKLLGSSVQNNAKVQIHALETGSVGILLRILVLDSDDGIKSRALFALGSLLRHFPLAQLQFIDNAGLNVFTELLEETNNIKIQLKVVTLINDLILEHTHTNEDIKNVNRSEKIRQYNQIHLKDKLKEHRWCKNLNMLLKNIIKIDSSDHDAIEKCLNAINSVINTCDTESLKNITDIVLQLENYYKTLALAEETSDESYSSYYAHLFDLCSKITGYLHYKFKSEL